MDRPAHTTVLDLITMRRKEHEQGKPFSDGYHLGLAVEGGGMRGCVSYGMLLAIGDLGLAPLFDTFYGTSAGSVNLAYFLSGGRWEVLQLYYDWLAVKNFVDRSRPLRQRRPVVDMGLLFDQLMEDTVPLDYSRLLADRPPLHIAVSAIDDVEAKVITEYRTRDELKNWLQAGSWLPVLSGPPYVIGGKRYLDGGVYFANPMYVAELDSRCTHLLSLSTRPQAPGRKRPSVSERYLTVQMNRWHRGAGELFRENLETYFKERDKIGFGETVFRQMNLFRLAVASGAHAVTRLTTDRFLLLEGARAGYLSVVNQIDGTDYVSVPFALQLPHLSGG